MKTLLFMPFLFVCSMVIGQSNQMIDKRFIFGNLEIAEDDFRTTMTWDYAKKACNDLGNGWRLPFINELEYIDNTARRIILQGPHWSCTYLTFPDGTMNGSASVYVFKLSERGFEDEDYKNGEHYVRCVRTIN